MENEQICTGSVRRHRRFVRHILRALPRRVPAALVAGCAAGVVLAPAGVHAAPERASSVDAHSYHESLRARLNFIPARVGGREVLTPDAPSRLLLARSAAERAGLAAVGLDFRDVYGVISAETSWIPRDGLGRNGVISQGLAQFEPATARALGVRNVHDPVEAVHAAATLLKEAALWSARRIAGLRLEQGEHAAKLREGVSIYYNLSSQARERWNGIGTDMLPVETQRHIRNVRAGAQEAEKLLAGGELRTEARVAAAGAPVAVPAAPVAVPASPVLRVAATRPATPQPVGTIEWSGSGSDADARRAGKHMVWSNGTVTRVGGRVRWSSGTPGPERNG